MEVFPGRLFGPGFAGTGVAALARWRGERLLVSAEGRELIVASPAIDAHGFNAAQLRVAWSTEAGDFVLMLDAGATGAAFAAAAPASAGAQMKRAAGRRHRVERRFRWGWAALGLFFLLPFLALGVFFVKADAIADWAVSVVPPDVEAKLGDLVLAQTRARMKLSETGIAADAVRVIGEKLAVGSVHRYRWFVAEGPEVNAFAAPGGVVVVFAGLLRAADSAEEAAGVIAHEVAHAELRHGLQGVVKSLGLKALLALALGEASGSLLADAAAGITTMRFSRDAERAADSEGLRRLLAARIDPRGMISFFEKLSGREGGATPPALLSTHPATGERIANLRREIATTRAESIPLAIDWAAVKTSLAGK